MKVSAISSVNPAITRISASSNYISHLKNDVPQPQEVKFCGKGLATLGGVVGGFIGAVLFGPIGAAVGAAIVGAAGAAQDDDGELDDYTREKMSHYD